MGVRLAGPWLSLGPSSPLGRRPCHSPGRLPALGWGSCWDHHWLPVNPPPKTMACSARCLGAEKRPPGLEPGAPAPAFAAPVCASPPALQPRLLLCLPRRTAGARRSWSRSTAATRSCATPAARSMRPCCPSRTAAPTTAVSGRGRAELCGSLCGGGWMCCTGLHGQGECRPMNGELREWGALPRGAEEEPPPCRPCCRTFPGFRLGCCPGPCLSVSRDSHAQQWGRVPAHAALGSLCRRGWAQRSCGARRGWGCCQEPSWALTHPPAQLFPGHPLLGGGHCPAPSCQGSRPSTCAWRVQGVPFWVAMVTLVPGGVWVGVW